VDKDRSMTVQGNTSETISGKLDVQVTKDIAESTDANRSMHAAKNITINADGDIQVQGTKITVTGSNQITLVVGGSTIKISDSGIEISGNKIRIEGKTTAIN
jgi:type VI secretion system secreted protein VgrG